jgi:hypothetical protein
MSILSEMKGAIFQSRNANPTAPIAADIIHTQRLMSLDFIPVIIA